MSEQVAVLTPTGRDADLVRERIVADGMTCEICPDTRTVMARISSGVGVAVIAEEALSQRDAESLLDVLKAQEAWSDIPVLLLTEAKSKRPPSAILRFFEGANITLLQRPLGLQLFLSVLRCAVRARRRQYRMRELYRELERAVQLSDMFVSILGHDLKTPLGAIKLSANTIVRLASDPRSLRPAGRIMTSAERMTRMIEQLLDFARVRQGRGIPLKLEGVHLGELCRQAVQEVEDANPLARIQIRETAPPSGVWDPDRLAQVVSNLVVNAVQHGTKGMPINVEIDGSDPSMARLRVQNFGAVPEEALPTIFEAFKTTAPAKVRSGKTGLGLGLFIAREIARAHGGELVVAVADDRTTFELTLPRQARPADRAELGRV